MSERQARIQRHLIQREAGRIGKEVVRGLIKPKPRWMPAFVFRRLVALVLNLKAGQP